MKINKQILKGLKEAQQNQSKPTEWIDNKSMIKDLMNKTKMSEAFVKFFAIECFGLTDNDSFDKVWATFNYQSKNIVNSSGMEITFDKTQKIKLFENKGILYDDMCGYLDVSKVKVADAIKDISRFSSILKNCVSLTVVTIWKQYLK